MIHQGCNERSDSWAWAVISFFFLMCVMRRDFCFSETTRIISWEVAGSKSSSLRMCSASRSWQSRHSRCRVYLISPQQRLAATLCHIRNLPAEVMHNWYEQMTWYRSVITSNEKIQQLNRTIRCLVCTLWFYRSESRSLLNLLPFFTQLAEQKGTVECPFVLDLHLIFALWFSSIKPK